MSKHNHEPTDTEMLDWAERYLHEVDRTYRGSVYLWYWDEGELEYVMINSSKASGKLTFRAAIKQAMVK